ncbi:MAG: hypothetical protein ACHQZR_03105 [Candidatus Limnocylindrales bacterium]
MAACSYETIIYDGVGWSGSSRIICQGTSYYSLSSITFDNATSSISQTDQLGHGFIYYTGPGYTDSSFKACGTQSYYSLSSPFNDSISSILATTSCPQ